MLDLCCKVMSLTADPNVIGAFDWRCFGCTLGPDAFAAGTGL